jgi:hypothetical protein
MARADVSLHVMAETDFCVSSESLRMFLHHSDQLCTCQHIKSTRAQGKQLCNMRGCGPYLCKGTGFPREGDQKGPMRQILTLWDVIQMSRKMSWDPMFNEQAMWSA